MQFVKFSKDLGNIVQRVRSLRMARHSDNVPGAEVGVNLLGQRGGLLAKAINLVRQIQVSALTDALQLLDFHLEFRDGLFKVEVIRIHGRAPTVNGAWQTLGAEVYKGPRPTSRPLLKSQVYRYPAGHDRTAGQYTSIDTRSDGGGSRCGDARSTHPTRRL